MMDTLEIKIVGNWIILCVRLMPMQNSLNHQKVNFGLYLFMRNNIFLESYIHTPNYPNGYPNSFDQVWDIGNI